MQINSYLFTRAPYSAKLIVNTLKTIMLRRVFCCCWYSRRQKKQQRSAGLKIIQGNVHQKENNIKCIWSNVFLSMVNLNTLI